MTAVAILAALELFSASAAPWLTTDAAVPALALLAGAGGAWLQAVHPSAAAHGHDPALVAFLVA